MEVHIHINNKSRDFILENPVISKVKQGRSRAEDPGEDPCDGSLNCEDPCDDPPQRSLNNNYCQKTKGIRTILSIRDAWQIQQRRSIQQKTTPINKNMLFPKYIESSFKNDRRNSGGTLRQKETKTDH